jgi:5'-3' exonuclease
MNILIIDTKLMVYTNFHRGQNITKMLDDVANLYTRVIGKAPDKIIFAMDKGKSKRADVFPAYKAQRKEYLLTRPKAYQDSVKAFSEKYKKFEYFLKAFANVIAIDGVEADDVASILSESSLAQEGHIYLLSSDADWCKLIGPNVSVLHPGKGLEITEANIEAIQGYTIREKILLDRYAGVAKENVPGLKRFGPKTFKKIWQEQGEDEDKVRDIIIEKHSKKLPEGYESIDDLYHFNAELLRPFKYSDLSIEEQTLLVEGVNNRETHTFGEALEYSYTYLAELYTPAPHLVDFYRLKY